MVWRISTRNVEMLDTATRSVAGGARVVPDAVEEPGRGGAGGVSE
jgi:hypothetical protein